MKYNKKSVFNVGGKYTCASSVKFDNTVETTKTIGLLNSICPETIRAMNAVTFNLLLLKGKPFLYNNKFYNIKSIDDELSKLITNSDISLEDVKKIGLEYYNYVVGLKSPREITSFCLGEDGPKKKKTEEKRRSDMLEKKKKKMGVEELSEDEIKKIDKNLAKNHITDFIMIRKSGIFPIETEIFSQNKYSIIKAVHKKLASYEESYAKYVEKKENWKSKLEQQSSKLVYLPIMSSFLEGINESLGFDSFNKNKYDRFLSKWTKASNDKVVSMYELFKQKLAKNGPDFKFTNTDNALYGYDCKFLNYVFSFKDLWQNEDVIGNKEYSDLIINSFYWNKELIHISSFDFFGKQPCFLLGKNYICYKMDVKNGKFIVKFKYEVNGEREEFIISTLPSRYFRNVELELLNNCKYKIKYCSDSHCRKHYTAEINEPTIRYSNENKSWYIDIMLTNVVCDETSISDLGKLKNTMSHFTNSSNLGSNQNDKFGIELDLPIKIMGLDIGLNPLAAIKIGKYDGKKIYYESEDIILGDAKYEECKPLYQLKDKIIAIKKLARATLNYKNKSIDAIPSAFGKKGQYQWVNVFGFSFQEYMANVDTLPLDEINPTLTILKWRKSEVKWLLKDAVKQINNELEQMRNRFTRMDWKDYQDTNHVSYITVLKEDVELEYTSLQKTLTFLGFSKDDVNKYYERNKGQICASSYRHRKGLRRKRELDLAAIIINIAIDNKVRIIALENLDNHTSSFNKKEENKTKSIWGVGSFVKVLANYAQKHNIAIVAVDPCATSQIDNETKLYGYREKGYLYVERDGRIKRINCHINAAKNILERMICRHEDLTEFYAKKMKDDKTKYIINCDKHKKAALMKRTGYDKIIFNVIDDKITIEENPDKSEFDKATVKGDYVVFNGKDSVVPDFKRNINEKVKLIKLNYDKNVAENN
jgi:hypothetical protein